jgi:nitrite reductase/ring-hydroxylating ferredoxin subunit
MAEFIRVARAAELPPGSSIEVEVAGRVVALFNVGGKIHAISGICPHAGGPLGEGTLDGTVVTCPWHGWQFDVSTGQNLRSPSLVQERYQVKIEDGDVLVALP